MAIMAVAAVASAGSVAVGLIAVETLATIALVTTAVGYVTDSPILKKIGAGMGIGSAGAGLMGLGEAAATTSASAANAAASSSSSVAPLSVAEVAFTQGLNTVQSMGLVDTLPTLSSTGAASQGIVSGTQAVNSASLANTPVNTAESMGLAKDTLSINAPVGAQGVTSPTTPFDTTSTITSKGFFSDIKGNDMLKLGGDMLKGMGQSEAQDQAYELQKSRLAMEQEAFNINKQKEANRNSIPLGSNMYNKAFQLKASALPSGIIQTAQKG
jgi:hypothetical protein